MTLTIEHDLDTVKVNQSAKQLGQMLFRLKVILRTH